LKDWLSIISEYGAGKLVIVPGAGVFAEQVRIAQKKWRFDDETAHQMALLAMEQYAHLLKSYAPILDLSDSIEGIETAVNLNQIPVWLPCKMINQCQALSSNWDLTSDSLALWLAGQLDVENMLLVKSVSADDMNSRQLSALNKVDQDFPEFVNKLESDVWWLDQNDMDKLKQLLKENGNPIDYLKQIIY
jgi:5-(aminomethyl)-3-furanmethanol phosphate kinase